MEAYFDSFYIWEALPQLLPFIGVTLFVTLIAVLLGTLFGFALAFMKLSRSTWLQASAHLYTTIMRCTPSIVLLFLIYYGAPALAEGLFQLNLQHLHTGYFVVTTFSLQFAAMMSEVIRSSILAVPKGQYEAAVSVGLTPRQAYVRIIFPQAIVTALPNVGNGIISVLQEGALAYTIGFIDLVGKANLIIANNYNTHSLEIYLALGAIYWVLTILIDKTFRHIERKFTVERRVA
ncbi:amino acid ABC transporter permease [Bacillaceae bacterium SIJ1]|uniref:amino acid ABC transporter permease n=1 Tax=Litoribacterium kuwaitense TaxID=1398745 RepID=UPI0013EA2558|nr:amino acid ABC transporter permease [Litoribacterium kuwaitense]NGP46456.1 amino acid ABC transporter permease [Litoribacterium kuwaitense]